MNYATIPAWECDLLVGKQDTMSHHANTISIWFFIGALLLVYGLLIGAAEVYAMVNPPAQRVVLHELHAGLWWGILLSLLGIFYVVRFRPRKS
jgi:hypothetical protein